MNNNDTINMPLAAEFSGLTPASPPPNIVWLEDR